MATKKPEEPKATEKTINPEQTKETKKQDGKPTPGINIAHLTLHL